MKKTSKLIVLLMSSCFVLTACTSTPIKNGKPVPEITFEQLRTIPVNVGRIEFVNETERGRAQWDIAGDLPTPPDIAMRRYLSKRFKANGTDGILTIYLNKAVVSVGSIPNENVVLQHFSMADNTDYTMEIIVNMENSYRTGHPNMMTSTRFSRKVKMPLNVTVAYREARLQRTLEEIIRDIDDALIMNMADKFGIIRDADVPMREIPVGTELPAIQTRTGVFIDNMGQRIEGTGQRTQGREDGYGASGDSFPNQTSNSPKPVVSEPLSGSSPEPWR